MLTDSHAHLTRGGMSGSVVEQQLARAQTAGITRIINIATDPLELEAGLALQKRFPWIDNAGATHPHDVEKMGEEHFNFFADHARKGNLSAVGETGLDYYYEHASRKIQQQFLLRYAEMALQCKLPLIIHCREAFADLFSLLDSYQGKAVLHCFTGTMEEAKQVLSRGWYLSLSGVVTFKKSVVLQEVAREVPLDRLLIETDSPFLAPHPLRGQPNEPAYLRYTAQYVASLRGVSLEELAQATSQNCAEFLKLV